MRDTGAGMRRCECAIAARRQSFLAQIPPEFGVPTLGSVTPDRGRHPAQADKLEQFRREPGRSYFIYGDNGTGKTFFGWALAVEAFDRGSKVVATDLDKLLKQYRHWQFVSEEPDAAFRPDRPAVLSADLEQTGQMYTIFLDEIGATTVTEYAAKEFFYLLRAAASYGHQVVLTCNITPQALHERWSKQDKFYGDSIARRIAEYSTQVNLFRPTE